MTRHWKRIERKAARAGEHKRRGRTLFRTYGKAPGGGSFRRARPPLARQRRALNCVPDGSWRPRRETTCAPTHASEDRRDLNPDSLRVTPAERGFEEELRVGLYHQPRRDRHLVGDLEDGLAATDRFSGRTCLLLEVVGETQDGDRDTECVLRSRRQESEEHEPG